MREPHHRPGSTVPNPDQHLSDWTLDQMAEGDLSPTERQRAVLHLEVCDRCSAELAGYRALYAALSHLPRFEPSATFNDAVIARVRTAPKPRPVITWLRGLAPKTRRGWILLGSAAVAPALPVIAVALWLLTHPLLTPGALWEWVAMQGSTVGVAATALLTGWVTGTGVTALAEGGYRLLSGVPALALTAFLVALAIAIPASAWALVRLLRTPTRDVSYAAN